MISRRDVLAYKSSNFHSPGNTILHDLILDNKSTQAEQVINDDISASDNLTIINIKALNNTPLHLALKTGNMQIARQLLKHPKIDVNLCDGHKLSPLHWACMLRQDDIIYILLDRGANPLYTSKPWDGSFFYASIHLITPLGLYSDQINSQWLSQYAMASQLAIWTDSGSGQLSPRSFEKHYPLYFEIFFKKEWIRKNSCSSINYLYLPPFCDRKDLRIPGVTPYTDIMFHMSDLCTNLGWTFETTQFQKKETMIRSLDFYMHNFIEGMYAFCQYRNNMEINNDIIDKLNPTKDIKPRINETELTATMTKLALL